MTRRNNKKAAHDSAKEQPKPEKISYARKMRNRANMVGSLSGTLVRSPKAFPGKTADALRPWLRKMWDARGGGLYACGFVVTFVYLEAMTLIAEVMASTGFVTFFTEQIFEMLFRFLGASLRNLILAFIWPVPIVTFSPPWGIAILVGMYVVFAYFVKEPLQRWLFHEADK